MRAICLTASLLFLVSCKGPNHKWEHPIYVVDTDNKQCRERKPLSLEKITWQEPTILPLESCNSKVCVTPEAYNDGKRAIIYYRGELRECENKSLKTVNELRAENIELKQKLEQVEIMLKNHEVK